VISGTGRSTTFDYSSFAVAMRLLPTRSLTSSEGSSD
jgi:hypothetical protein